MSTTCVSFSKPTAEVLTEYTRKVDFLKGLLEAEKLVSSKVLQINQFSILVIVTLICITVI